MGYFDSLENNLKNPGLTQREIDDLRVSNIKKDFKKIHNHIVETVIAFCKEYDIECDECMIDISNIQYSIDNGKIDNLWTPMTRSSFVMAKADEYGDLHYVLKSSS